MKPEGFNVVVYEMVNLDSAKAGVVEKYQDVRCSLSSFVLGDSPLLNLERLDTLREFRLI